MRFTQPAWLAVALAASLLLVWLWRRHDARQRVALARFVAAHLHRELTRSISVPRRRLQRGLLLAAVALLCIALAGPQYGYRWEQVSRRGNDIVFAVDTSRSMATPDVKPNRLARAKLAIDDFANRLDGDAVGIVAFAGSAYLFCPMTLDYAAFHESLAALDTTTIPRGGTNISSAIAEARAALHRRPGNDKILILVTDGEDLEGSALTAAQRAKDEDGLKIYTVGVGTAGGELIPVPAEQGGGFVKDDSGQFVKSRLDEAALRSIAQATGGFYVPLGSQGEGLDQIYDSVLKSLAKHDLASRQQKIYTERFQWPLAASLVGLLASLLIRTRRRQPARQAAPAANATVTALSAGLLLLLVSQLPPRAAEQPAAPAAAPPTTPAAAPAATPAANPIETYNTGTAAYRAGHFSEAAQAFQQSITHAPSSDRKRLADQQDAYYNLGNALYRTGQKSEQSSPDAALKQWNDAVKAYETALQLRADDADSKYNRDLVKRKIEQLKQQQQQQQQKQKQNQQPQPNSQQPQQSQQSQQPQQPQQPPPPQTAANGQPQGQPPQPPPNSAANPGTPPPGTPQPGAPQPGAPPPGAPPRPDPADSRAADNQHPPGQMSREEARELLDSVKGDEKRLPAPPLAERDDDVTPPDRPYKNW